MKLSFDDVPDNMKSLIESLKLQHGVEEREKRLKMCESCDRLSEGLSGGIPVKQFCAECGCFMPVKATLPWAKCPLGKW